MNYEELLKPRYKVIADYPNSAYKIGDILDNEFFDPSNYKHLFYKASWWEGRKIGDMPGYIKTLHNGYVYRVIQWLEFPLRMKVVGAGRKMQLNHNVLPATQAEYETFINSIPKS